MAGLESQMLVRVAVIAGAVVVLFLVLSWYNKHASAPKTTPPQTKVSSEAFEDQTFYAPMRSFPAYTNQDVAPKVNPDVMPSEEAAGDNSGFRAVDFGVEQKKAGDACFPRDRLTASDLLPAEDAANSKWSQVNPAGQGDVAGNNYLSAGFNIGINTVSGSLRNANLQLRSEPANSKAAWPIMNSTIVPDTMRRPLEIGASDCSNVNQLQNDNLLG